MIVASNAMISFTVQSIHQDFGMIVQNVVVKKEGEELTSMGCMLWHQTMS